MYLAPELLEGTQYGKTLDFWTLGQLMLEIVFECTAFEHNNLHRVYNKIINSPALNEYCNLARDSELYNQDGEPCKGDTIATDGYTGEITDIKSQDGQRVLTLEWGSGNDIEEVKEKEYNELDSVAFQDLILKLLKKDPTERLGANGIQEIMDHPFFTAKKVTIKENSSESEM